MLRISLIIVNYFTVENVIQFLNSLEKIELKIDYEVIIVNNSCKESINYDKSSIKINVIEMGFNSGFGKACNFGALNSKAEFLLFVNPDVVFTENPFDRLFNYIEKNPNSGVIGGSLLNSDGSSQYSYNDFPDLKWELYELFGITNNLIEKKINEIQQTPLQVDWVIGAFMFVKKCVFSEVGGFDEDFFLYYEDTDLQKKIYDKGYKNYLLPDVKVFHGTKSSIKGDEGNKVYNVFMNKSKMLYHYKHSSFFLINTVRIINLLRVFSRMLLFPVKFLLRKSSLHDFKVLIKNFTVYLHFRKFYYS
jgi:GT2 family glycosyltransferase